MIVGTATASLVTRQILNPLLQGRQGASSAPSLPAAVVPKLYQST